jgi:hypothetical protein
MQHEEPVVVYRGNIVKADLLKCLLEGQGITAWLKDELMGGDGTAHGVARRRATRESTGDPQQC